MSILWRSGMTIPDSVRARARELYAEDAWWFREVDTIKQVKAFAVCEFIAQTCPRPLLPPSAFNFGFASDLTEAELNRERELNRAIRQLAAWAISEEEP
jgi:hypothetical protein